MIVVVNKYMKEAYKLACKAFNNDEVPVGAVIVKNDKIIGRGYNQKENKGCAIMHAEIIAIISASRKIKDWRLDDTTMYVTLMPCDMCMAAIKAARISRVVYGVEKMSNYNLEHKLLVEKSDDDTAACGQILKSFFINKR
ncbi:MAG: nucleoside deaminase [bacterium]|nr:nucleoside deaminase [bacterium]